MTVTTTTTASRSRPPIATPTTMPTIFPPNGCSSSTFNAVDRPISCSVVPASVDCSVVAASLDAEAPTANQSTWISNYHLPQYYLGTTPHTAKNIPARITNFSDATAASNFGVLKLSQSWCSKNQLHSTNGASKHYALTTNGVSKHH